MTLAIGWLHEAGDRLGTWLHEAGDWQLEGDVGEPHLSLGCVSTLGGV